MAANEDSTEARGDGEEAGAKGGETGRGEGDAEGDGSAGYEADRPDAGGQYLDEGGYNEEHARRDPGNPLWDESLVVLLLVGGVALLLFPEPATSAVGALMIAAGVVAWLVDAI